MKKAMIILSCIFAGTASTLAGGFAWVTIYDTPRTERRGDIVTPGGSAFGAWTEIDGEGANSLVQMNVNGFNGMVTMGTNQAFGKSERIIEHVPPPFDVAKAEETCANKFKVGFNMHASEGRNFTDASASGTLAATASWLYDWDGFQIPVLLSLPANGLVFKRKGTTRAFTDTEVERVFVSITYKRAFVLYAAVKNNSTSVISWNSFGNVTMNMEARCTHSETKILPGHLTGAVWRGCLFLAPLSRAASQSSWVGVSWGHGGA